MEDPKFERSHKTDLLYTGKINGRTWVVPHSFDDHGSIKAMRHSIVVNPGHVAHNNPGLSPEEIARVNQHIKDIHGGQEPGKLDEERQLALHLGMSKSDKKEPAKEVPKVNRPVSTKSAEEKEADHVKYRDVALATRHADLAASRQAATLAFARKHGIIKERTIGTGSLKFNKIANTKPVTYNSFGKIIKDHTQFTQEDTMIQEHSGKEKRLNPDGSYRAGLKVTVDGKPGEISHVHHSQEHPKYPHSYKITDVSVNDPYKQTRLRNNTFISHHDVKPLNERTLTKPENAKKEEVVKSMKKKLQGFKERYGKDAKSVMYATATKQAKRLAESGSSHVYDVYHKGKNIDTIFYGHHEEPESVKRSLVNHDGYHPGIIVKKRQEKIKEDTTPNREQWRADFKKSIAGVSPKTREQWAAAVKKSKAMKEEVEEGLKPLTQYTYIPNRGHFVGGKKGDETFRKHQAEYMKRKKLGVKEGSDTFNTVKSVIREALRVNLRSQSDIDKYAKRGRAAKNLLGLPQSLDKLADAYKKGEQSPAEKIVDKLDKKNKLEEAVSRKDFQLVASLIKANPDTQKRQELANHHAQVFAHQNPRFDHARFHAAAGTVYTKG